jgi:hypothetical protein
VEDAEKPDGMKDTAEEDDGAAGEKGDMKDGNGDGMDEEDDSDEEDEDDDEGVGVCAGVNR